MLPASVCYSAACLKTPCFPGLQHSGAGFDVLHRSTSTDTGEPVGADHVSMPSATAALLLHSIL